MNILVLAVYAALSIFILIMWVRLIFDFVINFNRGWRPKGFALVIAEIAFTVTDPPIKAVRRVIPPLRIGGIALDFGWTLVMLAAIILSYVVGGFLN